MSKYLTSKCQRKQKWVAGRWQGSLSSVRKQLEKLVPKGAEKHESTAAKPGTSLSVNTMLLLNASSVKC